MMCQKCQLSLDSSLTQQVDVVIPNTNPKDIPVEAGGAWISFMKLFKKSNSVQVSQPAEVRTRQQMKCARCQVGLLGVYIPFPISFYSSFLDRVSTVLSVLQYGMKDIVSRCLPNNWQPPMLVMKHSALFIK